MRHRQEGQYARARHGNRANRIGQQSARLSQPVRVGQNAALGLTGGAGGIDQRRQVIRRGRRNTRLNFLIL